MAYIAFTLRNTISDNGSSLRRTKVNQDSSNPDGSGNDVFDSALRNDGYFVPVPSEYLESTFSINVYRRDEVELEWTIQTPLVSSPATANFEPVELLIRASSTGEPVTANDGILVKSLTSSNYIEALTDRGQPYIVDGGWIYYSLFIKYSDNQGNSFYEKVADLSIQIPLNFGSTENLWKRIPTYYRELDEDYAKNTPEYAYDDGPLHRFIELFGWEMDRIRTTIYDTMRINDPDIVHSSAIDSLANQTGIEFGKNSLGTTKLRTILNNIGYLRRSKGTQDSVEAYISALSGCGVSVDTTSPVINFNVHPMRVNLFADPFFSQAPTISQTTGNITRKCTQLSDNGGARNYGWGIYTNKPAGVTNNTTITVANGTATITLAPGTGTSTIYIYSRCMFTYNNNLVYYASAQSSHDFSVRFFSTDAVSDLTNLETGTGTPTEFDSWNNAVPIASFPKFSHLTRRIVGSIPFSTPPVPYTLTPLGQFPTFKFQVDHSPTASVSVVFKEPMIEYRNSSGEFFTGSTAMGGFIPNANIQGSPSAGLYDYHWGANASNTAGKDFSFYTLDFQRSKSVTEDVVTKYIMPVTMVKDTDYVINWEVLE